MTDLSTELIIFCILACLPARYVLKYKKVCKELRALLSTQQFEQAHYSKSALPSNQRTILIPDLNCSVYQMDFGADNYGPQTIIPFPIQVGIETVGVLAHLDGLLCAYLLPTKVLVLWNPTTNAYKHLSSSHSHGIYEDIRDIVGLYKGPSNDYNVLHVTRASTVIQAHIYSRKSGTWRRIPFNTKPEYTSTNFYRSPTSLFACVGYMEKNVLIGFDTNTEQLTNINFPPVPPTGIFQGISAHV
ncbi:putative F-box associated interaction domain, F-box-like domain superfamily [Helianthus annuus]|nr:putative F-box associated interaction domain, F-box-like domain superfamily [Helianthus annuus]